MLTISYTVTPVLQDTLLAIDHSRQTILTTPTSLFTERTARWQARIDHIAGSVGVESPISKSLVISTFSHPQRHHTKDETRIHRHAIALDWIRETWSANAKPVTPAVVDALAEIILAQQAAKRAVKEANQTIRYLTTYLSSQNDHPVLMASVAHAEIAHSALFSASRGSMCRLLTTLILTKYGYDCRGMLSLEPQWGVTTERYQRALASIETHGQMTVWHEYFSTTMLTALETLANILAHAREGVLAIRPSSHGNLNERQERILSHFDHPTAKITNRGIQQLFRVSQVTASRDLSRLASLGLIYGHGKGRSIYYTKL